jgi:hypothetical protein
MHTVAMQGMLHSRLSAGVSYEDVRRLLPVGLHAAYTSTIEQALELLRFHLLRLSATDAMTIPVLDSVAFSEYVSPCLCGALLHSSSNMERAAGRLPLPVMPRDAQKCVVVLPSDGSSAVPALASSASSTSSASVAPDRVVVFGSSEYRARRTALTDRVHDYVELCTQFFEAAFRAAMVSCFSGDMVTGRLGLLVRATPAAVSAMYLTRLRAELGSVPLPHHMQSCLGAFIASEMLTTPLSAQALVNGTTAAFAAVGHGEEVADALPLWLTCKEALPLLDALPPDTHDFLTPFVSMPGVQLFVKPARCLEILAAMFDVAPADLDIAPYLAKRNADGNVCPVAVATRLLECGYQPRTAKTMTLAAARRTRAGVASAVETARALLMALPYGGAGSDFFQGISIRRLVSIMHHGIDAPVMFFDDDDDDDDDDDGEDDDDKTVVHADSDDDMDGLRTASTSSVADRVLRRVMDVITLAIVDVRNAVNVYGSKVGDGVRAMHAQAAVDAVACVMDGRVIDVLPVFVAAVREVSGVPAPTGSAASVRSCFMGVSDWRHPDYVYTCCADRHAYVPSICTLLGVTTLCDCNDDKWTRAPAILRGTGMEDMLLCAFRLPTLSIHNIKSATPERTAVMALLANVALRVAVLVFTHIQHRKPDYGCCENGHAVGFERLLKAVAHHGSDIACAFHCVSKACNGCYDEEALLPFFPPTHLTLLCARRAWPTQTHPACFTCLTSSPLRLDGAVCVCRVCGDVTCASCKTLTHPGVLCGSLTL